VHRNIDFSKGPSPNNSAHFVKISFSGWWVTLSFKLDSDLLFNPEYLQRILFGARFQRFKVSLVLRELLNFILNILYFIESLQFQICNVLGKMGFYLISLHSSFNAHSLGPVSRKQVISFLEYPAVLVLSFLLLYKVTIVSFSLRTQHGKMTLRYATLGANKTFAIGLG
jgi:hypothetical protein